MPLFALSEQEVALLQKLLNLHKGQLGNVQGSRPPTEQSWGDGEDHQAPEIYLAKPQDSEGLDGITRASGTASDDYDTAGKGTCDIYRIVEDTPGIPEIHQIEGLQKEVYNVGQPMPQDWLVVLRSKVGKWLGIPVGISFVGFELAEDHPGKGIPFDIRLGVWSPDTLQWTNSAGCYDQGLAKAIDWRFGVPYPEECATGLGMWMSAVDFLTAEGTGTSEVADERIVEVWTLDCESPGCIGTGTCP